MHWSTTISTLLAAGVAGVAAQTPAGSYPITDKNLGAAYANATITPGIWIDPDCKLVTPECFDMQLH